MTRLDTIRRYYDGCSTGDIELMRGTLTDDVVHYFLAPNPGSAPVRGREHLARYWRKVHRVIDARWIVDHIVEGADEAVIEWSMFWRPEGTPERVVTRGAEWFVFSGGLISEIRSYYQQRERSTELDGFGYAERGYSVPARESSTVHSGQEDYRA
ncbi:nuclear transport factor 2 family protein [Amycolatopsis panacis]|uniref:Nuclear transport factor 2 family protein n=1 Tax=Amycolatopsis panacis TaxID=2340917 RepID=A0A419I9H1_9PSEU|nr:nuclear transport factor 2 family protein [Amycolatopsis panacis]RJQ89275.1 nuclear transport factor 2 family protein [Amycolatopsis panacis]